MILIGNPDYIGNETSKMANNSYRKRDADFSGMAIYLTPKGKFVAAYRYQNGKIVPPPSASGSSTTGRQAPGKQVEDACSQSQNVGGKQVNTIKKVNNYYYCVTWFLYSYDNYGNIQIDQILGTTCDLICTGGGSSSGGPSGGTTLPPPCQSPTNPTDPTVPVGGTSQNSVSKLQVNDIGSDGSTVGFPDPTANPCNANTTPPSQILDSLVANNPYFLFDCDSLALMQINAYYSYGGMYQQVAQFKPSAAVQNRIYNLTTSDMELNDFITPFFLQNLNQASGTVVNSDFFPVDISSLPPGVTMASLTEYFRLNINQFTSGKATFSPYSDQFLDDTQLFNKPTTQSIGALVHINMADNGTVVESDYQNNSSGAYFKFSTMSSPLDNSHPVSGNREFGVYPDPNNPGHYTFYTMGVDRTSDWFFSMVNTVFPNSVFNGADALWTQMQSNMINFINSQGGHAYFYPTHRFVARPDYSTVQDYLNGTISLDQLKQKIGCP
jgi:hypothetical protein